MESSNFFRDVSMAEDSGFGVWYEYLAKFRVFKKFLGRKKVLIFGLPEKYSLGLDTLIFSGSSEVHVVDTRNKNLQEYKKYANQFSKKIRITRLKDLHNAGKEEYSLLISTEVLQNDLSLMPVIKKLAKEVLIFVPNRQCYAHPRISHLSSLSLSQLRNIGKQSGMKVEDSGYIDCPPWPAGACLPKLKGKESKEPFFLGIAKKILNASVPLLTKFDNLYLPPWKELNSHMVYAVFKNGK